MKDSVNRMETATRLETLISNVKKAWMDIDPNILEHLVASMPNRMQLVIDMNGDYINK